jgi:uncharacterized protein (DUF342 family)
LTCNSLGNSARAETIVEVGIDERVRRLSRKKVPDINRNRKKIEPVRAKIEPLMKQPKLLTPDQKETATALLYDASTLEEATEKIVNEIRGFIADLAKPENPQIVVNQMLFPGVVIRFEGAECRIDEAIRGPLKIWAKQVGFTHKLVITSLFDDSTHFLKALPYSDPDLAQLKQVIADRKK